MFQKGDKVDWLWQPRGGYGTFTPVSAVVIGQTGQRVKIAVLNLRSNKIEHKSVKSTSLLTRFNALKIDEVLAAEDQTHRC